MAENSNNFEFNLIDSLIALNEQSETLNEYIYSFRNEIESAISTDNISITENLTPKGDSLNFDELEVMSLNQTENEKQESPFSVNTKEASQRQETNNITSKENNISESKIIEEVTANIEKTLSGLIKEEKNSNLESSVEIKGAPPANKVNDFFKRIAQEAKQQTPTLNQDSNSPKKVENKDTQSFLESLTPEELENLSSLDNSVPVISNNVESINKTVNIEKQNNKEQSNKENSFLPPTQAAAQQTVPFANFTPNLLESTLESYFADQQNNKQNLIPENIKFNDIQTLQKIINPQTVLNQSINKYNKSFFNTTNVEQPDNKKDDTLFYSFKPGNSPDQDNQQFDFSSNAQENKSSEFQQDSENLENFTNDESAENIASYFDGIDPVLDEILQNTKLTNQALEGIIKILPALMSGNGAPMQPPQAPASAPQMSPSLGGNTNGSQGGSNMQTSEGIPQIPRIRQQFLMTA